MSAKIIFTVISLFPFSYRWTRDTASSHKVDQDTAAIIISSKSAPRISPGRWLVTVSSSHLLHKVDYRIGAFLYDPERDPHAHNPDLYGSLNIRTVPDDADWEVSGELLRGVFLEQKRVERAES